MSFSPRQIAAHWVPGFTLLALIFLIDWQNDSVLIGFIENLHWNTGVAVLVAAAAGFVVGNFLDALRDWLIEAVLDRRFPKCRIEWDFLLEAETDKVKRLDDYYFTPYVLSANLVLGFAIATGVDLCFSNRFPWLVWLVLGIATIVFGQDAVRLRCSIAKSSNQLQREAQDIRENETPTAH